MSKENKEDEGGCGCFIVLLVIGFVIYNNYDTMSGSTFVQDLTQFVQDLTQSDKELIVGKWEITGGTVYSDGETELVNISEFGDNVIFGTLENPKYFIFSKENEFIETMTNGIKTYTPFEIKDHKIVTKYQDMEIIELTSKTLIFKEELLMTPIPGNEQYLGKIYYTFKTKKVR